MKNRTGFALMGEDEFHGLVTSGGFKLQLLGKV